MKELEHLLDLTRQVQLLAESGDWSEAARLDAQRRPLLESYMKRRTDADGRRAAAETLRTVIEMNRDTVSSLRARRSDMLGKVSRTLSAGRAIRAYLDHPAGGMGG